MQNEKNNSLPTQGGGAGDRETVAKLIADFSPKEGSVVVGWHLNAADAILAALQAAPSEPDTDNVSLLADLDAGKPCGREAAAVIRQLQADRKAAPSEGVACDPWRVVLNEVEAALREGVSPETILAACRPSEGGEPVAWRYKLAGSDEWELCFLDPHCDTSDFDAVQPLYARPPAPSEEPLVGEPTPEMIRVGAWRAKLHYEASPGDAWEGLAREVFTVMRAAAPAPDAIRGGE